MNCKCIIDYIEPNLKNQDMNSLFELSRKLDFSKSKVSLSPKISLCSMYTEAMWLK